MGKLFISSIMIIMSTTCQMAQAQPKAVAKTAVIVAEPLQGLGFKAAVAPSVPAAPQAEPVVVFPKMLTPYPNIGSGNTQGSANNVINNVNGLPPGSMIPNQTQSPNTDTSSMLQKILGGFGGGGGKGAPGGGTADGNDSTGGDHSGGGGGVSYGAGNGDTSQGDLGNISSAGGKSCNPPVRPEYAKEFGQLQLDTSISKVAGHGCNQKSTDRLTCMVCNLYFEVDPKDSYAGHLAVARSVMTRAMSSPYPSDVCHVVYQNSTSSSGKRVAQYSWIFERPSWNPNHVLPGPN